MIPDAVDYPVVIFRSYEVVVIQAGVFLKFIHVLAVQQLKHVVVGKKDAAFFIRPSYQQGTRYSRSQGFSIEAQLLPFNRRHCRIITFCHVFSC